MDIREMIVAVVYESPEGLGPLEIVESISRRFGAQVNTKQVLQTVRANPKLFVDTGGRVRRPSESAPESAGSGMDLKEMIVAVVYESAGGLVPIEIVESMSRRFGAQVNTKQVLQTVRANSKLFVDTEGRVKRPSDSVSEAVGSSMDLKEMMVSAVYDSHDGLVPLEIIEAVSRRFGAQVNTKQVLQTVRANPKMFVEVEGRVRRPLDAASEPAAPRMDLKEMMVTVVYESPEGLVPLEIIEAVSRRFGAQTNTRQVLQTVSNNPKLFVETGGRVMRA
jgi:hypothetical protein